MIFNGHKTSASLYGYVHLKPRILITCVYHNREKNKKSADLFFTSTPILSSAEIKTVGNHILLFLDI